METRILKTAEVCDILRISTTKLKELRKQSDFPIQPCRELSKGHYPADKVYQYLDMLNGKTANHEDDHEDLESTIAERLKNEIEGSISSSKGAR